MTTHEDYKDASVVDQTSTNNVAVKIQHKLEWHVESFKVQIRRSRAPGKGTASTTTQTTKTILQKVAGCAVSGELTAILGPSGAGKTTLLECISLRNRNFDGCVQYDGQAPEGRFFTLSAFVHQADMLYGFLTPREHLTFHAIARMSGGSRTAVRGLPEPGASQTFHGQSWQEEKMSSESMARRVEEVIATVKLEKCADTLIGGSDPVFNVKGISGGERKRLTIATELLQTNEIIFLDEPSSGLDSVMSESIFQTLKDLTTQGRIVIATVHCPSSKTYHLFSNLILLTCDGRLAYSGPAAQALSYFQAALGIECPQHYNPADFVLELVSAEPGVPLQEELRRMDALSLAYAQSFMKIQNPLPADDKHKALHDVRGQGASDWVFFKLNLWRGGLQLARDRITLILWAVVSALIGALFGVLYWQLAASNWRNLMGLIFSAVVGNVFTGCLGVVMRFPMEWTLVVREFSSGANAVGPYMIARFFTTLPLSYGPVLMSSIIYWCTGMDPDAGTYLIFVLIFVSFNWSCFSLGQWISSFSANPLVAMTIMPGFVT